MAPVEPVLSATVMMVRDAPDLQVFMAVRHRAVDFASGALVFPGGKVTGDDQRTEWEGRIDGDLGTLTVAGIAAVRETFEESGLLLCRPEAARGAERPLVGGDMVDRLGGCRAAVDRQEMSFLDLLTENGLVLALDRLHRFAHWITPTFMPKRFDTHFFLAAAPAGQLADHDGREVTDSMWIAPDAALGRAVAGQATVLFPTRLNLERLAESATSAEALRATEDRPVVPVMPEIERRGDEDWLIIPAQAGYRTDAVRLAAERGDRPAGASDPAAPSR